MKAFRNLAGNVVEIEVDLDKNGQPILPPDSTVAARPDAQEGHYVTVVGNEWVQIPIPVPYVTFESVKQTALAKLSEYSNWFLEQPVEHSGIKFDADEQARNRLVQALVIFRETTYLPPAWISFDNTPFVLNSITDLTDLIGSVQLAFSTRFFEMDTVRQQINAAADQAALDLITIPVRQNQF